jgi:hypothetical protein
MEGDGIGHCGTRDEKISILTVLDSFSLLLTAPYAWSWGVCTFQWLDATHIV